MLKNKKKDLKYIIIRLLIITFLFSKAMLPESGIDDTEKKEEVKNIISRINSPSDNDIYKVSRLSLKKSDHFFHTYAKGKSEPFYDIIIKASRRYNVDPALIKAVIKVESHYNPYAISYKGAKGLMQLMPVTLKAMGAKDPFNPEHNIDAGVRYLKKLLILFDNDVKLALAAYNAGITKVRLYGGVPPFKSTREYIRKVMRYYERYKKEMAQLGSNDQNV